MQTKSINSILVHITTIYSGIMQHITNYVVMVCIKFYKINKFCLTKKNYIIIISLKIGEIKLWQTILIIKLLI